MTHQQWKNQIYVFKSTYTLYIFISIIHIFLYWLFQTFEILIFNDTWNLKRSFYLMKCKHLCVCDKGKTLSSVTSTVSVVPRIPAFSLWLHPSGVWSDVPTGHKHLFVNRSTRFVSHDINTNNHCKDHTSPPETLRTHTHTFVFMCDDDIYLSNKKH